jgi:hypothetical protein
LSTASDSPVSIDSSICSPRAHDARIGRHLVAGAQHEDVGEHDGRLRDVLLHGVASHTRLRGVQQRELVEGGFGPELLHRTDDRVGDGGEAEEGVLPASEGEQDAEAREDDAVEQREDVGADDAQRTATGLGAVGVGPTVGRPDVDLRGAQSDCGIDLLDRCGRRGAGLFMASH